MSVRITGGAMRGRRLRVPSGTSTRPTASRVREAVFSMLGPITDTRVLDLFSGSGVLALEALSRGAASALLVDVDHRAVADARANADALGLGDRVHVVQGAAAQVLRGLADDGAQCDLVLLDPPYADAQRHVDALADGLGAVLAPGARIVLEGPARTPPTLPFAVLRDRRYGETHVQILGAKSRTAGPAA